MRALASIKVRIFLTCWIVYSLFFATNVVREHYPAFALIDRGDWVCDRYAGMHADLFRHTDGHVYTGNNLMGSLIAVPPLLLFDPVLDQLEEYSQRKLAENPNPEIVYDTKYPLRAEMFRKVKLAGLDLRFGAATAITSVFLMAPLSAMFAVLMFSLLVKRGVGRARAVWLAMLFAFATPVFYRTAHLNHNMFLMEVLFGAFLLLWQRDDETQTLSTSRRAWAGFLCGMAISLDYAGVVPAGMVALYFVVTRARATNLATALRESIAPVLAALPPIVFLLATQWAMYGNAFTPGQFVMPHQNDYVDLGVRGIGFPSLEVFTKNLISPSWGLLPFAPLLAIAFIRLERRRDEQLIFPRRERLWSALLVLAFMLFCAANWYSLLQFNTGFRYLLPVVPFLFLAASDRLAKWPSKRLALVTAVVLVHAVVLCMMREVSDTENDLRKLAVAQGTSSMQVPGYWHAMLTHTAVPASWIRLFEDGPQLPWLTVLRQTSPKNELLASPLVPLALMLACALAIAAIWKLGARAEAGAHGLTR
jgi:hypothetical protein